MNTNENELIADVQCIADFAIDSSRISIASQTIECMADDNMINENAIVLKRKIVMMLNKLKSIYECHIESLIDELI